MIDIEYLIQSFQRNLQIIHMQADGLSHEDSLIQLPFRGNCLNWVIGHVITYRDRILELLGEEPIWEERITDLYNRGSEPITSEDEGILTLAELLVDLERSQERMSTVLVGMNLEDFNKEIDLNGNKMTLGQRLFFLYFHETYHVGQTEYLRQLAGKDDAVIS